jgi:hypothetical protein
VYGEYLGDRVVVRETYVFLGTAGWKKRDSEEDLVIRTPHAGGTGQIYRGKCLN